MNPTVLPVRQNLLKSAVVVLLASVFAVVAYYVYKLNFDPAFDNRWAVADWLINYQDGGFKRRGLSGTFSFLIQDLTEIGLRGIVFASQVAIFAMLLIYLLKGMRTEGMNLLDISLLLTPWTLMVYLNSSVSYAGRKETILLFVFAYFIYHLGRSTLNNKRALVVKMMLAVAVLTHELTFFYIPYFIFALFLSEGKWNYQRAAGYFLWALIPMAAITLFGGKVDQGQTYNLLSERGIQLETGGTLSHADSVWAPHYITGFWKAYILYPVSLILGTLHLHYFLKSKTASGAGRFLRFFVVAVGFTLPLFLLALDWGRWIHIHFMMAVILIPLLLKSQSRTNLITESASLKNNLAGAGIILFSLFWHMDHCGYGFYPGGLVERILQIVS